MRRLLTLPLLILSLTGCSTVNAGELVPNYPTAEEVKADFIEETLRLPEDMWGAIILYDNEQKITNFLEEVTVPGGFSSPEEERIAKDLLRKEIAKGDYDFTVHNHGNGRYGVRHLMARPYIKDELECYTAHYVMNYEVLNGKWVRCKRNDNKL